MWKSTSAWYTKAIAYWENDTEVPATVDGVLGGFACVGCAGRARVAALPRRAEVVRPRSDGVRARRLGGRARIKRAFAPTLSQHDRPHAGRRGHRAGGEARAAREVLLRWTCSSPLEDVAGGGLCVRRCEGYGRRCRRSAAARQSAASWRRRCRTGRHHHHRTT